MNLDRAGFTSIEQVAGQYLGNTGKVNTGSTEISFEEVLRQQVKDKEQTEELKFSKHAVQRLNDRNISLSETQLERLQNGARLSSEKGIRESLVVMDEYAFIVNTRNNTVITAMEEGRQGENIYTNIDGAVFV